MLAHREAWIRQNGPIPSGLFVLHRCDNRICVNVDHLFLGTHTDNMRDMVAKGRRYDTHGERATRAKLKAEDIPVIRARYADGERLVDIAPEYDVHPSNISRALRSPWY